MRGDKLFKLDFRTKLILTMVLPYVLMLGNLYQQYPTAAAAATLLPYLFFLLERQYLSVLRWTLVTAAALLIQHYLLRSSAGLLHSFFLFMSMFFLRLLPGVMMGRYMLMSSEMGEIAYCMAQWKLPDVIIIPITVMSRFFHTIKEDYGQIRHAMRIHGLSGLLMLRQPLRFFEYRLVPLLMVVTKTADDVAVSAMTRGMRPGEKRSYFRESHFRIFDYVCLVFAAVLVGLYLKGKYA